VLNYKIFKFCLSHAKESRLYSFVLLSFSFVSRKVRNFSNFWIAVKKINRPFYKISKNDQRHSKENHSYPYSVVFICIWKSSKIQNVPISVILLQETISFYKINRDSAIWSRENVLQLKESIIRSSLLYLKN